MTDNPPATADESALTVTRRIRIRATREKVWSAITDPAHISRWFAPTELDRAGSGGVGTIAFPDSTPVPLTVHAIDPLRSVTYRWNNDDSLGDAPKSFEESSATEFTFSLDDADDGTFLTVVETGFENTSDPVGNARSHRVGWTDELDKLVRLLEVDA